MQHTFRLEAVVSLMQDAGITFLYYNEATQEYQFYFFLKRDWQDDGKCNGTVRHMGKDIRIRMQPERWRIAPLAVPQLERLGKQLASMYRFAPKLHVGEDGNYLEINMAWEPHWQAQLYQQILQAIRFLQRRANSYDDMK